jgi:hypothetical protein
MTNPYGLSLWSPYQSTMSSLYSSPYMLGLLYPVGWPAPAHVYGWRSTGVIGPSPLFGRPYTPLGGGPQPFTGRGLHPGGITPPVSPRPLPPRPVHPVSSHVGGHK